MLENLAVLHRRQGRPREGIPLLERAVAIQERAHGPTHPLLVNALQLLGVQYEAAERFEDAERCNLKGLHLIESGEREAEAGGREDGHNTRTAGGGVVADLRLVINIYLRHQRSTEAMPYLQQLVEQAERASPPAYQAMVERLNGLGGVRVREKDLGAAEGLFQRAL